MGKYLRGGVNTSVGLGTLAAQTLIGSSFPEAVTERTLISSIVARYSMDQMTKASEVGPIFVGIAHDNYTDAEIEAWVENSDSWNVAQLVDQEVAGRKCRKVGIFEIPATAEEAAVLNDGKPIKTKLNWMLESGQTLKLWAYNLGTQALATTQPNVDCQGHANLWVK